MSKLADATAAPAPPRQRGAQAARAAARATRRVGRRPPPRRSPSTSGWPEPASCTPCAAPSGPASAAGRARCSAAARTTRACRPQRAGGPPPRPRRGRRSASAQEPR
jgi:hypothetical protein